MISTRANILEKVKMAKVWAYIRDLRHTDIPFIALFREMTSSDVYHTRARHQINLLNSLEGNIYNNFDIIPPEMRPSFMVWMSEVGEPGTGSLLACKTLHDKIIEFNKNKS